MAKNIVKHELLNGFFVNLNYDTELDYVTVTTSDGLKSLGHFDLDVAETDDEKGTTSFYSCKYVSDKPYKSLVSSISEAVEFIAFEHDFGAIVKSLTIRLNQEQVNSLELAQEVLQQNTASKTFINSVEEVPVLIELLKERDREIEDLYLELQRLNSVVENARNASFALIDSISQSDIFDTGNKNHSRHITDLELTVRTEKALIESNINTLGDLVVLNQVDLLRLPKITKRSLLEIEDSLTRYDLCLIPWKK